MGGAKEGEGNIQTMKHTLAAILLGLGLSAFAATPTITDVTAAQRYPWNGKVDTMGWPGNDDNTPHQVVQPLANGAE